MARKATTNSASKSARNPAATRASQGESPSTAKPRTGGRKGIAGAGTSSAARLIDRRIEELQDWRGKTLARMRSLIMKAAPGVVEEWKWSNPVWSHPRCGIICTGETYAKTVKLTFAKGAHLEHPSGLFNASLTGGTRRAIDIREGETVDARAFAALISAAVNAGSTPRDGRADPAPGARARAKSTPRTPDVAAKATSRKTEPSRTKSIDSGEPSMAQSRRAQPRASAARAGRSNTGDGKATVSQPRLLSGGNPQIAKGYGDEPVRAYIDAMPGWKQAVGRMLDAIIVRTITDPPGLRKAVKWNSPLYGVGREEDAAERGWFMSLHCFNRYVKVAFFRGSSLRPLPPGESKQKEVRYLDIYEADLNRGFDEARFAEWVRQASRLPGEKM